MAEKQVTATKRYTKRLTGGKTYIFIMELYESTLYWIA